MIAADTPPAEIVVTATRSADQSADERLGAIVIGADRIAQSASGRIEDALSRVAGLQSFTRPSRLLVDAEAMLAWSPPKLVGLNAGALAHVFKRVLTEKRFSEPEQLRLPLVTGTSPRMARPIVVFPLPDSPTRPSTSPRWISRSTPSTAFAMPRSV